MFGIAMKWIGVASVCMLGAMSCDGGNGGTAGSGGAAGTGGEGGSAAEGGSAGAAGSSGQGGNAGMAGSSGAGGSGGSSVDGGAGSGGTGGSDGDAGAPPACDASEAPALGRMGLEPVVQGGGLSGVVNAAQPPGSDDWYLVELTGRIMVYADGELRDTPFLDLQDQISLSGFYDERGLLSITFAPDYESSGRFYVTLIPTTGDDANHDLVLEYTRSSSDPYVADTSSQRAIMDLAPQGQAPQGWNNYHNASTARFGPDGMLYVGIGDGGGQCNSANPGSPQQTDDPYGKILRLDPSKPAPHGADGNPFEDEGDARVLHYGLRNPFRFAFDSITGDLYIGDVGQWAFEEVSVAPYGTMGLNFGWPEFEAMASDTCPDAEPLAQGDTHTPPIHSVDHGAEGGSGGGGGGSLTVAIVGGAVYRGDAMPELYGAYLFGEYYPNRPMGALYHCDGETSDVTAIRKVCDPNNPDDACFDAQNGAPDLAEVGAIIEGNDGELYLAANGSALLKVVPAE